MSWVTYCKTVGMHGAEKPISLTLVCMFLCELHVFIYSVGDGRIDLQTRTDF